MADSFTSYQDVLEGPSRNPYAVSDVVYRNVASGVYLDVRATGTTASDFIAEA